MVEYLLAIIGTGEMGSWIAEQLVEKNIFRPEQIVLTRRNKGKLEKLAGKLGTAYTLNNCEAARNSKRILLSVRPQQMQEVLEEIKPFVSESQIIMPVAVGLGMDFYEKFFPKNQIIRIMPNPFISSNLGLIAYSKNRNADAYTIEMVKSFFGQLCESLVEIDDGKMHAFSTMAACSSAIFWEFFNSVYEQAKEDGFDEKTARELTLVSALAASKHSLKSEESLLELINSAATPGGMTIEGIKHLRENGFAGNVKQALQKISERSREIDRQLNK